MTKPFLFTLALMFVSAPLAMAGHGTYSDPSDPYDYEEAIHSLVDEGIVKGNENGDLNEEGTLNRAELTAIVLRAKGIVPGASDKNCFSDVSDEWFAGVVCAAKRLKILDGYPDGLFRPGREVTAGEAAKILVNGFTEHSYQDLSEALRHMEGNGMIRQIYTVDKPIKRNEAFERLYRVRRAEMNQQTEDGRGFDPVRDTLIEMSGTPMYIDYHADQLDRHLGKDPIILFFHAEWCPLCRKSEAVIQEGFESLEGGVIWMKVDYDTELELRKEYGITYQDTFIVLNAEGEEVERQNGVRSTESAQELMNAALSQ